MLVKIAQQLTNLDCFKRKMCSTPLFIMGFRDNYVMIFIPKSDQLDQQRSLKYRPCVIKYNSFCIKLKKIKALRAFKVHTGSTF